MTSSASSTGSKTPVKGNPPMSKDTGASGSYPSGPIEGSSKETNDQPQGSKTPKTSHNRTSSESSRLLAYSHISSFGLSENVADGNRDSQQSTKAGTANEDDNEYDKDNESDNDNETIRPILKRHSSSHPSLTNVYTDCGRHSGDWLFKPLAKTAKTTATKTVKTIFGTKEQK
ncbi:hypothetical protein G7Y89_g245 [Cudoniella acicularis]|uniref:Uncharacterized protein n=1 Tax=Cudoniella acicularis TaxID=354080 RepID=A0A8H4WBC9_9HELO|nr:hypothetical protein G7Y89_g245 [Cudoniella acicularis]